MNTSILRISDYQGAVRRILLPGMENGRPLPANSGFISDRHPFLEVLIALEGTCDYPLDDRLYSLTPGTAVLIPPWCVHSYGYRSCDTELIHLWLHFQSSCHGSGLRVSHGIWSRCPELSFPISPELVTLLMQRWENWKQTGKPGMENLFFRNLLNLFLEEKLVAENQTQDTERNVVWETITLIRNSNGRGCSLDFLAEQVCCSKYHLAHRVQEATGRTIGSFIEEARLRYVHSAKEHGLTQKEIAWNLGFSSAVSFWNWYHKKNPVKKNEDAKDTDIVVRNGTTE